MSWFDSLFGRGEVEAVAVAAVAASTKPFHEKTAEQLDILTKFVKRSSREISPSVYSQLRSIDDAARPLIDYIATHPVEPAKEYAIEALLTDYIPTPLGIFLQLPEGERRDGGKADLLLIKQYGTLEKNIIELGQSIYVDTMNALETHARFIDNKFSE